MAKKYRARQKNSCLALSGTFRAFPRVGQRVSLDETPKIKCPKKVADYERKSPESTDSGDFWWRLLDSNQWPHACEDPSGYQRPAIRRFPVLLAPLFQNRQEVIVHCVHPLISGYWLAYWSNPRLRQLGGAGDAFPKRWPCCRDGILQSRKHQDRKSVV